jgi:hypothetical protein
MPSTKKITGFSRISAKRERETQRRRGRNSQSWEWFSMRERTTGSMQRPGLTTNSIKISTVRTSSSLTKLCRPLRKKKRSKLRRPNDSKLKTTIRRRNLKTGRTRKKQRNSDQEYFIISRSYQQFIFLIIFRIN